MYFQSLLLHIFAHIKGHTSMAGKTVVLTPYKVKSLSDTVLHWHRWHRAVTAVASCSSIMQDWTTPASLGVAAAVVHNHNVEHCKQLQAKALQASNEGGSLLLQEINTTIDTAPLSTSHFPFFCIRMTFFNWVPYSHEIVRFVSNTTPNNAVMWQCRNFTMLVFILLVFERCDFTALLGVF